MMTQLQKNIDVEKMPSVRVRPTLRVELKHRVLNQKIPKKKKKVDQAEDHILNFEELNEQVILAMKKSKRANIGGESNQLELIERCQTEIAKCKNLDEIRKSIDAASIVQIKKNRHCSRTSQATKSNPSSISLTNEPPMIS